MTAAGFAKYALLRMHDDGLICARSGRPSVAELATIGGDGEFRTGAPDTIRTCGLRLRRATLYPAELRVPSAYAVLTRISCE